MKQTRKWLALALAGALSLSLLAGCAGNNTPDASSGSSTSQETQEPAAQADATPWSLPSRASSPPAAR